MALIKTRGDANFTIPSFPTYRTMLASLVSSGVIVRINCNKLSVDRKGEVRIFVVGDNNYLKISQLAPAESEKEYFEFIKKETERLSVIVKEGFKSQTKKVKSRKGKIKQP